MDRLLPGATETVVGTSGRLAPASDGRRRRVTNVSGMHVRSCEPQHQPAALGVRAADCRRLRLQGEHSSDVAGAPAQPSSSTSMPSFGAAAAAAL